MIEGDHLQIQCERQPRACRQEAAGGVEGSSGLRSPAHLEFGEAGAGSKLGAENCHAYCFPCCQPHSCDHPRTGSHLSADPHARPRSPCRLRIACRGCAGQFRQCPGRVDRAGRALCHLVGGLYSRQAGGRALPDLPRHPNFALGTHRERRGSSSGIVGVADLSRRLPGCPAQSEDRPVLCRLPAAVHRSWQFADDAKRAARRLVRPRCRLHRRSLRIARLARGAGVSW